MAAIGMVVGALIRRRVGTPLSLVLLVGLAGGAVLATTAGARATTAYPRLLDRVDYADVIVVEQLGELTPNAVERVPQVHTVGAVARALTP
jgi:hypothetical protein